MRWATLFVVGLAGCGAAAAPAPRETPTETPAPAFSMPSELAAPVVELRAATSDEVLLRGALLKDATPTDAWDPAEVIAARAFCIGDACFALADRGPRSVSGRVVTVASGGTCEASLSRARAYRAHLPANDERPAVEQSFVVLEVEACASGTPLGIFGGADVEVIGLRGAAWAPADTVLRASLEAYEERNRALVPSGERVPILAAPLDACHVTLARGLAVYWIHDGVVNQPFDAARFVRVGPVLYALSAVEGLDPLVERLDRVHCE